MDEQLTDKSQQNIIHGHLETLCKLYALEFDKETNNHTEAFDLALHRVLEAVKEG